MRHPFHFSMARPCPPSSFSRSRMWRIGRPRPLDGRSSRSSTGRARPGDGEAEDGPAEKACVGGVPPVGCRRLRVCGLCGRRVVRRSPSGLPGISGLRPRVGGPRRLDRLACRRRDPYATVRRDHASCRSMREASRFRPMPMPVSVAPVRSMPGCPSMNMPIGRSVPPAKDRAGNTGEGAHSTSV